jgi:hypothetical protein
MPARLRRLAPQAALGLALLLLPAASSKAQFPYFGYPGYGFGYGAGYFGYPGFGVYPPFGFPTAVGFGAYGFGAPYAGISPLGYGGFGPFGDYPLYWYNPATLSLGITPLAIQSAVMDRGLSGDSPRTGGRLPAGTYRIEIRRVDDARKKRQE